MIYKKKILEIKFLKVLLNFFKKIIFSVGMLSFILMIWIIIYYFSSGLSKSYSPFNVVMQLNDKVFKRYVGFDLRNTLNYLEIINLNILSNFTSNKLENVYLEINQETILGLELQRKLRSQKGGELTDEEKVFHPAVLKFNDEKYNIKLRTKGVRPIHWKKKDETSYKIDIRGSKRLWGMEEFSVQKPVTRNYTYEYLFHNLLGYAGLLKIKYFFVNLYLNDRNLGVYAVEESFSKELVERQGKRNGPIFSLKDELGEYFPNVKYELYSDSFWISKHPKLIKNLFSILNNFKKENFSTNDHFDVDKWAKYFAIMDLTGSYHGSLLKSVKLYYNPTVGLFEPIGFDLHKNEGLFNNFIIMDFLKDKNDINRINCSYICDHEKWYLKFLKIDNDQLNIEFIEKYLYYLNFYSEPKFLEDFLKLYSKKLSEYNNAIYKDNSKTDKITRTGAGYFVYDNEYLLRRAELIKSRINSTNLDSINISYTNNMLKFEEYGKIYPFPVLAQTKECLFEEDKKKFFLFGRMSFYLKNSCKKIEITSLNKTKLFPMNENITMADDNDFNIKEKFKNLREYNDIVKVDSQKYIVKSNIDVLENTIINKNENFIFETNTTINIINGSTLFIEGQVNFVNNQDNFNEIKSEDGSGSLIFINNDFNLSNLVFKKLSKPRLENYILYGGVNFINSKVNLNNIYIQDSNNEDGINIINSKSNLTNIYFNNMKADAFDVDFGELNFFNVSCVNINNDCLDISGAKVTGQELKIDKVLDKGISVGEKSLVSINDIKISNNNIALAVKDGSDAYFDDVYLTNNNFDIVLFNKKKEFLKPSLEIDNITNLDEKKILQSIDTKLLINNKKYIGNLNDGFINSKIY